MDALSLRARYDVPGESRTEWIEYDDLVIAVPNPVKLITPMGYAAGDDWSFIVPPATSYWNLPLGRLAGAPWAGLSTESPTLAGLGQDRVLWRVDAVTGPGDQPAPGDVVLWEGYPQRGGFGMERIDLPMFSTKLGLPAARWVPLHTHAHFNWSITRPGVYCVAMTIEAQTGDGRRVSDAEQLTLAVGDGTDASTVTPCGRTQDYPERAAAAPAPDPVSAPFVLGAAASSLVSTISDGDLDTQLSVLDPTLAAPGAPHDPESVIFHRLAALFRAGTGNVPGFDTGVYGNSMQVIHWDATGIRPEQLHGDLRWSLHSVAGPGDVALFYCLTQSGPFVFNTAIGPTEPHRLWTGAGGGETISAVRWSFSRPGKYCLTLEWAADLPEGHEAVDRRTLTFVVDGPLDPTVRANPDGTYPGAFFTHDAETLTRTCVDGGRPTRPEEVPVPGGEPDPVDDPWNVPNWSRTVSGAVILNSGHVDIASTLDDGGLRTRVMDTTTEGLSHAPVGGGAYWHEMSDVVFQLLPGSATTVPSEAYSFIGPVGSRIWSLSQTEQPGLLWPGWSAQTIQPTELAGGGLNWTLTAARGPGDVFVHQIGPSGAPVHIFESATGLPDTTRTDAGSHVHANWTFTAPGSYCLAFERTGSRADGARLSDAFTLAVVVGEADPSGVDPQGCVDLLPGDDPDPVDDPWDVPNWSRTASGAVILNRGYVDIASMLDDGGPRTMERDLTIEGIFHSPDSDGAFWHEPSDVVLQLLPESQTAAPSADYGFIGPVSSPVWGLSQAERPGLLWLSWSAQAIRPADLAGGGLSWSLTAVDGPGDVFVYQTGPFGAPVRVFGSATGLPDSTRIGAGTYAHGNWMFTAQGSYCLAFERAGSRADGVPLSDAFTLAVVVGEADPTGVDPGDCAGS